MTFYSLRSYRDNGQHYEGQLGDEATPAEFLRNLWAVMDECHRVLKPNGSAFIELGEKFQGSGGHNNSNIAKHVGDEGATRRNAPDSYRKNPEWARPKSLMGLPWAFALGLINPELFRFHIDSPRSDREHPRWILRAEIIWNRVNGLPESVTDRVRRAHSAIFHLVKSERYYSAVDEIREGLAPKTLTHRGGGEAWGNGENPDNNWSANGKARVPNPLGSLPGSVWSLPSEPLLLSDYFIEDDRGWRLWGTGPYGKPRKSKDEGDEGLFDVAGLPKDAKAVPELVALWAYAEKRQREGLDVLRVGSVDHFAAFGTELPRRLILGFSPPGICTICGEGRRLVVERKRMLDGEPRADLPARFGRERAAEASGPGHWRYGSEATIFGYACSCAASEVSTTPARVLDPFGGTGTTAGVARSLGRVGISLDLSANYSRLARWRIEESGAFKKAEQRTWSERQGTIL